MLNGKVDGLIGVGKAKPPKCERVGHFIRLTDGCYVRADAITGISHGQQAGAMMGPHGPQVVPDMTKSIVSTGGSLVQVDKPVETLVAEINEVLGAVP